MPSKIIFKSGCQKNMEDNGFALHKRKTFNPSSVNEFKVEPDSLVDIPKECKEFKKKCFKLAKQMIKKKKKRKRKKKKEKVEEDDELLKKLKVPSLLKKRKRTPEKDQHEPPKGFRE